MTVCDIIKWNTLRNKQQKKQQAFCDLFCVKNYERCSGKMKKTLSAKLLLLFLTTCMLNLHISSLAFAYDTEETTYNECEVIIEFDEDADTESVKNHIFEVLNGKFEIVAEYDTLIKGIAAKIPTYKLLAVECINGVKCVSDSLEYEALDTSSENNIKKQRSAEADRR